jgi:hypothetical protein
MTKKNHEPTTCIYDAYRVQRASAVQPPQKPSPKPTPAACLKALATYGATTASDDDKAAALDLLTDFFNARLDAEDKRGAEMASALATLKGLTVRLEKVEKASAARAAALAKVPPRPKDGVEIAIERARSNTLGSIRPSATAREAASTLAALGLPPAPPPAAPRIPMGCVLVSSAQIEQCGRSITRTLPTPGGK